MLSLSGDCSHPNGVVFDLPQTAFVMYPALFTSVERHLRANLGHSPFKYAAPSQEYVAFASLAPCGQTVGRQSTPLLYKLLRWRWNGIYLQIIKLVFQWAKAGHVLGCKLVMIKWTRGRVGASALIP